MFAREAVTALLIEEIKPLLKEHHKEIPGVESVPFDPDYEMYFRLEKSGILRVFTLRDGPTLCGYQVFMVIKHPHSKDSLQANQDILYLKPAVRKGLLGYRFVKWCSEQLRNENVKVIYQHISARNDFGHLLERMGFKLQDLVYSLEA